jgi:hypothetical protein
VHPVVALIYVVFVVRILHGPGPNTYELRTDSGFIGGRHDQLDESVRIGTEKVLPQL